MSREKPELVIVELHEDALNDPNYPITAEDIAEEIVGNLESVKLAYPAYDNGFGHMVKAGDEIVGYE